MITSQDIKDVLERPLGERDQNIFSFCSLHYIEVLYKRLDELFNEKENKEELEKPVKQH